MKIRLYRRKSLAKRPEANKLRLLTATPDREIEAMVMLKAD